MSSTRRRTDPIARSAAWWPRVALAASVAAWLIACFAVRTHAGESLPDPTRPPAEALPAAPDAETAAPSRLELRALFHADDRRIAVLDGRRVAVGDRVGDATVLAIEVDRIRLRRGAEIVEIELVSPAFKNARRAPAAPRPAPDARGTGARSAPARGATR